MIQYSREWREVCQTIAAWALSSNTLIDMQATLTSKDGTRQVDIWTRHCSTCGMPAISWLTLDNGVTVGKGTIGYKRLRTTAGKDELEDVFQWVEKGGKLPERRGVK